MIKLKEQDKRVKTALATYAQLKKSKFDYDKKELEKKLQRQMDKVNEVSKVKISEKDLDFLLSETGLSNAIKKTMASFKKNALYTSEEFEQERAQKDIQFEDTKQKMGRPTLSVNELTERAIEQYKHHYSLVKIISKHLNVDCISEAEIQKRASRNKKGRTRRDEVLQIMKHIRRTERNIEKSKLIPDEIKQPEGKGRRRMTRDEAVTKYAHVLAKANAELNILLSTKTEFQKLYYKLYDQRNKVREAKKEGNEKLLKASAASVKSIEKVMWSMPESKGMFNLTI